MNSIEIIHTHSYDQKSACEIAENMLEDIANDYGLEIETSGDGFIKFSGSGINGNVEINHEEIKFSATLGFLMIAMKPVISNAIQAKLDEKFD
jgi:putative polyhydroxyalkanoate system protein